MQILNTLPLADGLVVLGLGGAALLIFLLVVGLLSIFWIWMLIDCVTSNLPPVEKIIWALIIFWLHFLGGLLYFIVARPGGRTNVV